MRWHKVYPCLAKRVHILKHTHPITFCRRSHVTKALLFCRISQRLYQRCQTYWLRWCRDIWVFCCTSAELSHCPNVTAGLQLQLKTVPALLRPHFRHVWWSLATCLLHSLMPQFRVIKFWGTRHCMCVSAVVNQHVQTAGRMLHRGHHCKIIRVVLLRWLSTSLCLQGCCRACTLTDETSYLQR